MGVSAHTAFALRSQGGQFGLQRASVVKELLRPIALHPLFEDFDVFRVLVHLAHRDLVRSPVVFRPLAIDLLRTRPSLRGAQHDHGPTRTLLGAILPRIGPRVLDVSHDAFERGSHELVHFVRLMSLDKVRCIAIATE